MATYTIKAPDGNSYTVQGPDNASQEDVQQEVLRQHPDAAGSTQGSQQNPAQQVNYKMPDGSMHTGRADSLPQGAATGDAAKASATDGMSTMGKIAAGAGKSVMDKVAAVKQIFSSDKARSAAEIDEMNKRDKALMSTYAGQAGDILGNMAMTLGTPGGFVAQAAVGGASGALTPTGTGESRGSNIAIGAVLGGAGQTAGKLLGKIVGGVLQPFRTAATEAEEQGAKTLLGAGVPLSAEQQGGGKLASTLTGIVQDNPFIGSTLVPVQKAAFTKAVLATVGVDSATADKTVMARISAKLGSIFDQQAAKYPIPMDNALLTKLATIETAASSELGPNELRVIQTQIDNLIDKASATGTMPGEAFQNARSSLARLQQGQNITGHWAGEIHDALTDALGRNAAPDDAALISKARTQWKALKQITPAIDANDHINPTLLYNSLDRQKYTNQMVYGKGDQTLVQLATAGKLLMNKSTPNSGTTQRAMGMLAMGSSLAAVDSLVHGDPKEAVSVGLLGAGGPAMARMVVENPQSARIIGQWARSKVLRNFRGTVEKQGAKLMGIGASAAFSANGGSGIEGSPDQPEDLAGTEQ